MACSCHSVLLFVIRQTRRAKQASFVSRSGVHQQAYIKSKGGLCLTTHVCGQGAPRHAAFRQRRRRQPDSDVCAATTAVDDAVLVGRRASSAAAAATAPDHTVETTPTPGTATTTYNIVFITSEARSATASSATQCQLPVVSYQWGLKPASTSSMESQCLGPITQGNSDVCISVNFHHDNTPFRTRPGTFCPGQGQPESNTQMSSLVFCRWRPGVRLEAWAMSAGRCHRHWRREDTVFWLLRRGMRCIQKPQTLR